MTDIPKFISLEGGEGAGKSTQARLLAEWLRSLGHAVVLTREPGGSPGAERIRRILLANASDRDDTPPDDTLPDNTPPDNSPGGAGESGSFDGLTEAMLHYAARRDHCLKVIRPALHNDSFVISDRFSDSTTAYQGYGFGVSLDALSCLDELAVPHDVRPGLTLFLDIPPASGLARAHARGEADASAQNESGASGVDRYESEALAVHERIAAGFDAILKAEPDRVFRIDATLDVETVHVAIREQVQLRFGLS